MSDPMLVGVLPLLVLATVIQVEGVTTCPRPEQVAARLGALLPGDDDASGNGEADRARLDEEAGELVVVLERPTGDVLGTRRFPGHYACEDLAAAVAVSLAVWVSDVHPTYSSAYPAPPPTALPLPAAEARVSAVAPARPPPVWGAGLAVGLGGSVDVPIAGADAVAGAWLRLRQSRTALRAELEAQSRRELALPNGKGEWRRWVLGLGIERTLSAAADGSGAGWLRGFATARLALLDLEGAGFTVNHRSRAVDPGAAAGLRATWDRGSWASWIELALSVWPIRHDAVAATSTNDVQRLPALEGFLRVGAGWGAAR